MRADILKWQNLADVELVNQIVDFYCPVEEIWLTQNYYQNQWACKCEKNDNLVSIITSVIGRRTEFIESLISLKELKIFNPIITLEHVIHDADLVEFRKQDIELFSTLHTFYHRSFDSGIYNGFNIGLKLSHGQYICFLNSDDTYLPNFIEEAYNTLSTTNTAWVFGDTNLIGGSESLHIQGQWDYFKKPYMNFSRFHHTSVMTKRTCFEKVGVFPEKLGTKQINFCGDYAWFLKAQKNGLFGTYNPRIVGQMKIGGVTTTSFFEIYIEAMKIALCFWPKKSLTIVSVWLFRIFYHQKIVRIILHCVGINHSFISRAYAKIFRVHS